MGKYTAKTEGWQGCVRHLIFPFSQQNCWELVKYWLLWPEVTKHTTPLPLSVLPSLFHLYMSLYHAPSWLVPNLNVQNRGSKVSQSTFPYCWCCNLPLAGLTILIAVPSAIDGLTWADSAQPSSGLEGSGPWQNQDPQDLPWSSRPRLSLHFFLQLRNTSLHLDKQEPAKLLKCNNLLYFIHIRSP